MEVLKIRYVNLYSTHRNQTLQDVDPGFVKNLLKKDV